ncbi:tigger transposable element-derived protein 7-like [Bacillus rossius redtenbacheri]|uniref:tigger transposable element-derived protein 7-like n=1 Tax=Bacillus rossius redtenbacheri TaxID=93214 RepID=UPI002FDD9D88
MASLCVEFGIAKQTVSDTKKQKEKLKAFAVKCDAEETVASRKRLKFPGDTNLEEAVHRWYVQQRSSGVAIRGVELQAAADKLAKHMNIQFKASDGWLWRFRYRHGIVNKRMFGEALNADTASVEPFRKRLCTIIDDEGPTKAQLYNADETGLFWRSLPENTQAYKHEGTAPGRKLSKERLSALLCANADGSHRLSSVVVGKSRRPRKLKDMTDLPVHYTSSKNAWFTQAITGDWFHKQFVPEVKKFQTEVLDINPEDVKALLIVDNAPSHPDTEKMCSQDGKIKCLALPPNTTSLIQPMDQGIILACKRIYKKKLPEDKEDDTRGMRTLQNIRNYSIRSAIFNWASAWKEIKTSTLANGWNKLLFDGAIEPDFLGFEASDYQRTLMAGGETGVTKEDVTEWLDADEGDLGYQFQTEEEIAQYVLSPTTTQQDTDKEDELGPLSKQDLSSARQALDTLINIVDSTSDADLQSYYRHFRAAQELVISKQQHKTVQKKIDSFFKPSKSTESAEARPADLLSASCSYSDSSESVFY